MLCDRQNKVTVILDLKLLCVHSCSLNFAQPSKAMVNLFLQVDFFLLMDYLIFQMKLAYYFPSIFK